MKISDNFKRLIKLKEVKEDCKLSPNEKIVFENYNQISFMSLLKLEFALLYQIKVLSDKISK